MSRNTVYVLCALATVALLMLLICLGVTWMVDRIEQNGWFAVFAGAPS